MNSSFFTYPTLLAILCILLLGAGCLGTETEEPIEYEDVYEMIEEIDETRTFNGSCNVIATKSTCVDYVGSFWDTLENMDLNCAGTGGTFSTNTCPYSELGGCATTPGTITETIAWSYGYGGQPISVEEAGYQAMACNALGMANWVSAEQANEIE